MSRPRRMRPSWLLLLATVAVDPVAVDPAAANRAGKVVRVERPHLGGEDEIRFCSMMGDQTDRLMCLGKKAPRPGATIELIEFQGGYRGKLRVTGSEPSLEPGMSCNQGVAHSVSFDVIAGDVSSSMNMVFGFTGLELDPERAKMVSDYTLLRSPSGRDNEQALFGIDANGSGEPDYIITYYDCTTVAPPIPGSTSSGCIDYWHNRNGDWRKLSQDIFYTCT